MDVCKQAGRREVNATGIKNGNDFERSVVVGKQPQPTISAADTLQWCYKKFDTLYKFANRQ